MAKPLSARLSISAITALLGAFAFGSNIQIPGGITLKGIPAASNTVGSLQGVDWEIDQGSTSVATSTEPNGWLVSTTADGKLNITAPAKGPSFELTAKINFTDVSATPNVKYILSVDFDELPGADYLANAPSLPVWALELSPKVEGPSENDYTDAATGVHVHENPEDIKAFNPSGPEASYQITYRSSSAAAMFCSPGLSFGWTDSFTYAFFAKSPGAWGPLELNHPDGATEVFVPQQASGADAVTFTGPAGTPYTVEGVPSDKTGEWKSVTIYFKTLASWTFLPEASDPNSYLLTQISNGSVVGNARAGVGRSITVNRDASNDYRITTITNDDGKVLLKFNYDGAYLQSVQDIPGSREVDYGFESTAGTTCLTSVSQIFTIGGHSPGDRFDYSYSNIMAMPATAPFLTSITAPSPAGVGTVQDSIAYIPGNGQVRSHTDADGHVTLLFYGKSSTQVKVLDRGHSS